MRRKLAVNQHASVWCGAALRVFSLSDERNNVTIAPTLYATTLVTRIDNPWLLLPTLPFSTHALKMTPLPLFTPVCNFEPLLGAS